MVKARQIHPDTPPDLVADSLQFVKELKEMQQATMAVQGITPPAIQAPVELAQAAVTTPPPALVQPDGKLRARSGQPGGSSGLGQQ